MSERDLAEDRKKFERWGSKEGFNLQLCNDPRCMDAGKHYAIDGSDQLFAAYQAGLKEAAQEEMQTGMYNYAYEVSCYLSRAHGEDHRGDDPELDKLIDITEQILKVDAGDALVAQTPPPSENKS